MAAPPRHVGWFYLSQLLATLGCASLLLVAIYLAPNSLRLSDDVPLCLFLGFVYAEMTVAVIWFACGRHRILPRLSWGAVIYVLAIVTGMLTPIYNRYYPSEVVVQASLAALPAVIITAVVFATARFAGGLRFGASAAAESGYRFPLIDLVILIAASAAMVRVFRVYEPNRIEEFGHLLRLALPVLPIAALFACVTAWVALSAHLWRLRAVLPVVVFVASFNVEERLLYKAIDTELGPQIWISTWRAGGALVENEIESVSYVLLAGTACLVAIAIHAAAARWAGFLLARAAKSNSATGDGPP